MEAFLCSFGGVIIVGLSVAVLTLTFKILEAKKHLFLTVRIPTPELQAEMDGQVKAKEEALLEALTIQLAYDRMSEEHSILLQKFADVERISISNRDEIQRNQIFLAEAKSSVEEAKSSVEEAKSRLAEREITLNVLDHTNATLTSKLENTVYELGQANTEFNRIQSLYQELVFLHESVFDTTVTLTEALVESRAQLFFLKTKCGEAAIWFLEERYTDDNPEVEAIREEANRYVEQLKSPPVLDPLEAWDGDYTPDCPMDTGLDILESEVIVPGVGEQIRT